MTYRQVASTLIFFGMLLTAGTLIVYGAYRDPTVDKRDSVPMHVGICDANYISVTTVREAVEKLEADTGIRFLSRARGVVCEHRTVSEAGGEPRIIPWKEGYTVFALRDQVYGDRFVDQTFTEASGVISWATILVPEHIQRDASYPAHIETIAYMHGLAHAVGYGHAYLPIGPMTMVPKGHLLNPDPRHMGFTTRGIR